jgi:hypothetical protein
MNRSKIASKYARARPWNAGLVRPTLKYDESDRAALAPPEMFLWSSTQLRPSQTWGRNSPLAPALVDRSRGNRICRQLPGLFSPQVWDGLVRTRRAFRQFRPSGGILIWSDHLGILRRRAFATWRRCGQGTDGGSGGRVAASCRQSQPVPLLPPTLVTVTMPWTVPRHCLPFLPGRLLREPYGDPILTDAVNL